MHKKQFTVRLAHHFIIFAKELGAVQEFVVLVERDDRLRQLPEIQLEQRSHRVHVRVAAGEQKEANKTPGTWRSLFFLAVKRAVKHKSLRTLMTCRVKEG